uniref:Putative secreted protein n=1 Tax=Ixodes ricinus TaxID=34613 RepID=A0A6B0UKS7_IXORI
MCKPPLLLLFASSCSLSTCFRRFRARFTEAGSLRGVPPVLLLLRSLFPKLMCAAVDTTLFLLGSQRVAPAPGCFAGVIFELKDPGVPTASDALGVVGFGQGYFLLCPQTWHV